MSKILQFTVHGSVSIDLDDVVFTRFESGDVVEIEEIKAMSIEEINQQIKDGDLDWDWLQVYRDTMDGNLSVDDVEVIED